MRLQHVVGRTCSRPGILVLLSSLAFVGGCSQSAAPSTAPTVTATQSHAGAATSAATATSSAVVVRPAPTTAPAPSLAGTTTPPSAASAIAAASSVEVRPQALPPVRAPKQTPAQALACAQTIANLITPNAALTAKPGFSSGHDTHWFTFAVAPNQSMAVAVKDEDCAAALSPNLGGRRRFDAKTARRFLTLRARADRAVAADPERKALCARLEKLKSIHPNLEGCVSWLEHFPDDLCVKPAPPSAGPFQSPLNHECYWQYYLGESMGRHTNRHFTLVVDAAKGRVIGARGGFPPGVMAATWRQGPLLRRTLNARLRAQPAIRRVCGQSPVCPDVGGFSNACKTDKCLDVSLGDAGSWPIQTDGRGVPRSVVMSARRESIPFADWLKTLSADGPKAE